MSNENGLASPRHGVVDSRGAIGGRRHQFVPCAIETNIQNLVVVTTQGRHTLARSHVPDLARSVNGAADAQVSRKVELRAGNLPMVAAQGMDTPAYNSSMAQKSNGEPRQQPKQRRTNKQKEQKQLCGVHIKTALAAVAPVRTRQSSRPTPSLCDRKIP